MAQKLGARVVLGIPTLTGNQRTINWINAMADLHMPLGSSMARLWIEDESIANARNQIVEKALELNADYIVFLGDDVLMPPNALLIMLDHIGREYPVDGQLVRADMVTGVYWTKAYPPEPYIWNDLLKGSFRDWRAGDFFPIDLAGCDALMIDANVFRTMERPWFSTDWVWEEGQPISPIATEDFYFFAKARKLGYRMFCASSIQCLHVDRATHQLYGIMDNMPQARNVTDEAVEEAKLLPDGTVVAELGSGTDTPFWGENVKVVRFDIRKSVKPDVQCDIRRIPHIHMGKFDMVHARHVLEHFPRGEAMALVRHWTKLLKVGGKVVLNVPNLAYAFKVITEGETLGRKATSDELQHYRYAWAQLYGGQNYAEDFHRNGFTAKKLGGLLRSHPCLTDIVVQEVDEGQNLEGSAVLAREDTPESIAEWWEEAKAKEAQQVEALRQQATRIEAYETPDGSLTHNEPPSQQEACVVRAIGVGDVRNETAKGNRNL